MHFQIQLAGLLEQPRGALGPIARTLGSADVTMANLESAVTDRGARSRPRSSRRPTSATGSAPPPPRFDVLHGAGIDVVTMANNHGADYGPVGLADTLRGGSAPAPCG